MSGIERDRIIKVIRDLMTEDGSNPEYDRACVQIASDLGLDVSTPSPKPYVLYYVSADGLSDMWSVYKETYSHISDHEPTPRLSVRVASFPSEEVAQAVASLLQSGANL